MTATRHIVHPAIWVKLVFSKIGSAVSSASFQWQIIIFRIMTYYKISSRLNDYKRLIPSLQYGQHDIVMQVVSDLSCLRSLGMNSLWLDLFTIHKLELALMMC